MKKILRVCTTVLLGAGILVSVAGADEVYRAGGNSHDGQTVNSYTNAGAQHFRQTMRTSGSGNIYNVEPKVTLRRSTPLHQLKIPATVSFKQSLCPDLPDRYLGHGSARVELSEIIEKHAKRFNLDPMLVEEVIRQESNFQHTATSPVGAQGLMQLMPGTAAMLGVSNSNDPDQNIAGGACYLAQQLTRFGRLDYALAAYNAGPGSVDSHGGIPPYTETRNYVARIVNAYNNRVSEQKKLKKNAE